MVVRMTLGGGGYDKNRGSAITPDMLEGLPIGLERTGPAPTATPTAVPMTGGGGGCTVGFGQGLMLCLLAVPVAALLRR